MVGSDSIVLPKPAVDHDLSLAGRCEPLGIEHFVTQRAVEALVVSVLPWRSRIDPDWFGAGGRKPFPEAFTGELGPLSDRILVYCFDLILHS